MAPTTSFPPSKKSNVQNEWRKVKIEGSNLWSSDKKLIIMTALKER
jgi:hypothetical protein